ncbi:MAG: urease accessory protein UreD [Gordonia sp. (in: high G+C Gram-positive bacteria)]|uniref:urease accessory protein UreD n=1 Tax=Gordonia sp. (in: high G+C Gram-positive bacteria) TaxID=84139 RepID=UPI0039E6D208
MQSTVVEIERAAPRARVTMSAGAGTVLVPRLLDRTETTAHLALVAGGAMLLGGDRLDVRIRVGDGCTLELTEVGGTVAYGTGRPDTADVVGEPSVWTVDVVLGADATLLWMGRETVVADGADLTRTLTVTAEAGATAVIRETTVLGRSGERGGRARLVSQISYDDVPLLVEDTDVRGDRPVPGILGEARVFDTVLIAGRRPADERGAMALAGPGALARHLGHRLHHSPLEDVFDAWRADALASTTDNQNAQMGTLV